MAGQQRNQASATLGLDIGGANLKAASSCGKALGVSFPLWRRPQELPRQLRRLLRHFDHHRIALTMTGELCDCYATKRQGVHAILDAVIEASRKTPIQVWSTQGRFVDVDEARAEPMRVAAANWHALATFAGRFASDGAALLIDIGSTTTDIIPLWQGRPVPHGLTDPERLAAGELVYTGVRRTPVCAVLTSGVAAELFATMHDVYLVLGKVPEEPENGDTADGRPATRAAAHARLARMRCDDVEHFPWSAAVSLARRAREVQRALVADAIQRLCAEHALAPRTILLSGTGEDLARKALHACADLRGYRILSLAKKLGPSVSAAACAYALAVLSADLGGTP